MPPELAKEVLQYTICPYEIHAFGSIVVIENNKQQEKKVKKQKILQNNSCSVFDGSPRKNLFQAIVRAEHCQCLLGHLEQFEHEHSYYDEEMTRASKQAGHDVFVIVDEMSGLKREVVRLCQSAIWIHPQSVYGWFWQCVAAQLPLIQAPSES